MIRRLLVALDPSPYASAATRWACMMAKRHGAEVTGLVVLDEAGISKAGGPVPLGGQHYATLLRRAKRQDALDHIQGLLATFVETCQREGVEHAEAQRLGSPSDCIVEEAVYYDVIVLGLRTYFHFATREGPGHSLDAVLDRAVTPVYAVPKQLRLPDAPPERIRVLLAFDASPPAARALQRLPQLAMPEGMEVVLLRSGGDRASAMSSLEEAAHFLRKHSFPEVRAEWTAQPINEAVADHWFEWTDLFVLGAHSKRFLSDFFLGSFAKFLLQQDRKPLLMVP